MSKQKQTTFLVVTLICLSISGEMVAAGTSIEVDRGTRADWLGSKLARDATEDEIAEYYGEQDGDEETERLAAEVKALEAARDSLRTEIEQLGQDFDAKSAEVKQLTADRDALQAELAKASEPKAKAAK